MIEYKLLAAFGIGAIFSKIIEAIWIQPFIAKKETNNWLREKRLEAYVQLSSNILSFGIVNGKENTPFEDLADSAAAILLTDDEDLYQKIYSFIAKKSQMYRVSDDLQKIDKGVENLYAELVEEGKQLVFELRNHLRSKPF